jgi:siroheme synthase
VPGVTSAVAVPAAAGIPLTRRGVAASFAVVSGARADGEAADSDAPLSERTAAGLTSIDTVVVLMGRASLAAVARQLINAGRDPDTPVACIASGTTPSQLVARGTLATIGTAIRDAGLEPPVVTVIGPVAGLA